MSKTSKTKRYRWTRANANTRFEQLSEIRQDAYKRAFLMVKHGASITQAAKSARVDRENFSTYVKANSRFRRKKGGALKIYDDKRHVTFEVYAIAGKTTVEGYGRDADLIVQHRNDRKAARLHGKSEALARWEGKFIEDRSGNRHYFLFSIEDLFSFVPPSEADDEKIYAMG